MNELCWVVGALRGSLQKYLDRMNRTPDISVPSGGGEPGKARSKFGSSVTLVSASSTVK